MRTKKKFLVAIYCIWSVALVGESNRSTHHMNDFIVLMEQWSNVEKYIDTANNASGESMQKYSAYTDSLQGKLEGLENSFQSFSNTALSSDIFKGFVSSGTSALNILTSFVDQFGLLNTAMIGLGMFQGKTGSGKSTWKSSRIFFKMDYAA